nr:VP1 [bovine rhinitis B virus 1]
VTDVGETGRYKILDATQQNGHSANTFRLHTDVSFALDRYALLSVVSGNASNTHQRYTNLDPTKLPADTFMKKLIDSCTYYFSDLEVTVIAKGEVPAWANVIWHPVGAPHTFTNDNLPDDVNVYLTTSSNVSVGFTGPSSSGSIATFAVPYTSFYRVLPTKYAGRTLFVKQEQFEPFNHGGFGEIITTGREATKHRVLIRMKRAEMYCPRALYPSASVTQ